MYIFTQLLGDRPFVLTAVCPAEDVYGRYSRMEWFLWLRGVAGVLILLIVLYAVVGRHLRPLHWLADSAQSIANGNLETPIPDAHHEHEAGRLQNSLSKMQQALKAFMTEMQQKQVTLSKQNADLKAAFAEVQAYQVKKTNFVRDMTAQMAKPVERLCQEAHTICHDAASMPRKEITQRQTVIMKDSDTAHCRGPFRHKPHQESTTRQRRQAAEQFHTHAAVARNVGERHTQRECRTGAAQQITGRISESANDIARLANDLDQAAKM